MKYSKTSIRFKFMSYTVRDPVTPVVHERIVALLLCDISALRPRLLLLRGLDVYHNLCYRLSPCGLFSISILDFWKLAGRIGNLLNIHR